MKKIYILLALSLLTLLCAAQPPTFLEYLNDPWVEKQMERLSLEEKIGQLIMIEVYTGQGESQKAHVEGLLARYKPGGILMMQGAPHATAQWVADFQKMSATPLLVAMDAENGPAFRIDSIMAFPCNQALGAIQNDSLLFEMGCSVARQLKLLGVNMNFAPVADINTTPSNPVINFRSFGENPGNVARKAWACAAGMQSEGVAAVAKHFPGHGDTKSDSHHTLPELQHSKERMATVEIYPFQKLSDNGIAGVMTGHISVPIYDPSKRAASLSAPITTSELKENMGFKGLVITDAMNMKGVSMPAGQAEVQALIAGNDMVEFVTSIGSTMSAMENAVKGGVISQKEIDEKCRKILALKRWMNLNEANQDTIINVAAKINSTQNEWVIRKLTESSLTVLRNANSLIPLARLDTLKIATVSLGTSTIAPFQEMVSRYAEADHFFLSQMAAEKDVQDLMKKLNGYNLIISGVQGLYRYPTSNYGVTEAQTAAVKVLSERTRNVTLFFGNAYAMRSFSGIENSDVVMLAYQDTQLAQELAVEALFGAVDATGRLPVSINSVFAAGAGIDTKKNGRLKYTLPEEAGILSEILNRKIDSIINVGLVEKAYPGCQVVVAKDGMIILDKNYGYLTYENTEPVTRETMYDWASVTKVCGPLPALIKLHDEGKFGLDKTISAYLPDFKGSNKENMKIRDILTHQAQLRPIIPLWHSRFARNPALREEVFRNQPHSEEDIRISSNLYMDASYKKDFYDEIKESTLLPRKSYTYTCIGFQLWPPVVENITGKSYEEYLKSNFYRPLGATSITYNPYLHFSLSRIAPTEVDDYFRMETLRGFVHDEGAALLGGVSGNAGLFGTANDLAKLFQMYLWKGYYGGQRFFSEEAVNEFTRVQFPERNNRRGLGFDKPELKEPNSKYDDNYPAKSAGPSSYGHNGYTGTFVWADPDAGILLVFLTNRVYPTRDNSKVSNYNIRGDLLQAIYDSMDASAQFDLKNVKTP